MTAAESRSQDLDRNDDRRLVLHNKAMHQFGYRLHRVQPHEWDLQTPCEDWSVRDLVAHVVGEQRWIPLLVGGADIESATRELQGDGDSLSGGQTLDPNPRAAWDLVAGPAVLAFAGLEDLSQPVDLSRGPTPARDYLAELTLDLAVHAWDLGQAVGLIHELPRDLAQFCLELAESFGDLSSSGMFKESVQVPAGASATDRLVAATGRSPH